MTFLGEDYYQMQVFFSISHYHYNKSRENKGNSFIRINNYINQSVPNCGLYFNFCINQLQYFNCLALNLGEYYMKIGYGKPTSNSQK